MEDIVRRVMKLVVSALLVGLVAACNAGGTSPAGGEDGPFTLVWGKETDPAGINPLKAGDIHAFEIFSLVYEPLTQPTEDLEVGPGLAETWEETSPTTWRFTLRDDVAFSNGRALTSADVVGTWEALKELDVRTGSFPNVDTMTVVDPLTFDVQLAAPMPDLPARMELFWVLPAEELAAGTFNPDEDLLGTGPFVAGEHVSGVSWTFEPNPHYWRDDVREVEELEIKFIPDDASRLAALRTGEIDFTMSSNPDIRTILEGDPSLEVTVQDTTDLYYLSLNSTWTGSPFVDQRIRQAVALTIDRQQIIDTALGGIGELTAITPSAFADACDPAGVLGAEGRDVDAAKELLAEAGVSELDFQLTVVPAFGALRGPQIAQVIQQNLQEIGLHAEVGVMDGGAWLEETFTNGTFQATLNWFTGGGSSSHLLSYMDPERAPILAHLVGDDPATLGLVREALALPPGEERADAVAAACESLNEQAFFIPLATKPTVIVYRSDRVEPVLNPIEPVQMTFRRLAEFGPAS
ncbi:hypothetical protein C1I92_07495 [Jiangella anatolica]|uniref:Solute-binding protein family 5 domain-containing protein n=1 Tax=Jiangella anatolica TaxID=2670374 RepID=A0A2W2BFD7_9ACTN|nr:hypothetical protein C1I92_07495 [Jiangella anatolica]